MEKSAINFKAYKATLKVHKWIEKTQPEAPRPGGGGGGGGGGTPESDVSIANAIGVRTVKVSGFEKLTAADIEQNEGVLRERLERKACRGGPLESLEVKQPRRAAAKPCAIATFKSATGEPRNEWSRSPIFTLYRKCS